MRACVRACLFLPAKTAPKQPARTLPLFCGFPSAAFGDKEISLHTFYLNPKYFLKKSRKKFSLKSWTSIHHARTHARKRTPGGGFFFCCCCCRRCFRTFFFRGWPRSLPQKWGARSSCFRQKQQQQLLFFVFYFVREKIDFFPSSKTNNNSAKKKTKTKKKRGDVFFFFARRRRRNDDGAKTRPSDGEVRAQTALSRRKRKSPAENLLERSQHVGV